MARRPLLPRSGVSEGLAGAATARPAPDWGLSGRKVEVQEEDSEEAWAQARNLIPQAAPGLSQAKVPLAGGLPWRLAVALLSDPSISTL